MAILATERPAPVQQRAVLPAPKYRKVFGVGRSRLFQYVVIVILALFVIAPIVPILYQSFTDRPLYEAGGVLTVQNYLHLFTDAGNVPRRQSVGDEEDAQRGREAQRRSLASSLAWVRRSMSVRVTTRSSAPTTVGQNCVPAQARSSVRASERERCGW